MGSSNRPRVSNVRFSIPDAVVEKAKLIMPELIRPMLC